MQTGCRPCRLGLPTERPPALPVRHQRQSGSDFPRGRATRCQAALTTGTSSPQAIRGPVRTRVRRQGPSTRAARHRPTRWFRRARVDAHPPAMQRSAAHPAGPGRCGARSPAARRAAAAQTSAARWPRAPPPAFARSLSSPGRAIITPGVIVPSQISRQRQAAQRNHSGSDCLHLSPSHREDRAHRPQHDP